VKFILIDNFINSGRIQMADTYIEMFEETYYPAAFLQMALHTVEAFDDRQEEITASIKKSLDQYMEDLAALQEMHLAGPVAEITISFLYTSMNAFRIDAYGERGHVLEDTMLSGELPAPWLVNCVDEMVPELEGHIRQEGLRRYIRPAELERLRIRALRSLLYYFASRFRYVMEDALDGKRLAKIKKTDAFAISMGEYMDWQKVAYALLPEIDIFNCGEETLCFRRFSAIHYKGKKLEGMVLNSSRFTDCVFRETAAWDCQMNDCIFDGCTFEETVFKNTEMIGCLFIDCNLENTSFEKVAFYADPSIKMQEYYEPAEFFRCGLKGVHMKACDLRMCGLNESDINGLTVTQSETEDSGFEGREEA